MAYLARDGESPRAVVERVPPAPDPKPTKPERRPSVPEPAPVPQGPFGTVKTVYGKPVVGAQVMIDSRVAYETDADGRFEFEWPEGKTAMRFRIKHHELLDLDEKRERTDGELSFVLERGESIAGRVVYPDGTPAAGIRVNAVTPGPGYPLEHSQTQSDENGYFELTGLRPGAVSAQCQGDPVPTRTGTRDLQFTIEESWLRLRLENRAGELVAASYISGTGNAAGGLIDEEGQREPKEMHFPVIPGSDLEVRVVAPGYRRVDQHLPAWSKTAAPYTHVVVLEPSAGASILLDVVDARGARPEHFEVQELGADGKPRFHHRFLDPGDDAVRIGDLGPKPVV